MKKPFTKFGPWFKAQFPHDSRLMSKARGLRTQLDALMPKVDRLRFEVRESAKADDVYNAALKGWVAGFEAGKLAAMKEKSGEEAEDHRRGHRRARS